AEDGIRDKLVTGVQTCALPISLSTPAPASVAKMPASVTVAAGATSASFTITTSPVTSQFNMNINADLAGSPGQQTLLLITPGGEIGRASCRERGWMSGVGGTLR